MRMTAKATSGGSRPTRQVHFGKPGVWKGKGLRGRRLKAFDQKDVVLLGHQK